MAWLAHLGFRVIYEKRRNFRKKESFMAEVRLENLSKKFDQVKAVDQIALDITDGDFLTLV